MAIEKFKFVSPGVQVAEIDESIRPLPTPVFGPVIIGNTAKGPSMQPVLITSINELETLFGSPSNGVNSSEDIWRSGAPTSPTFATYAAKAFLQNSAPVTVIRLAGVEYVPGVDSADQPGWKTDKVYQIHAINTTENKSLLIANIYASSSITAYVSTSAGYSTSGTGSADNNSFKIKLNNDEYFISLVPTSGSFIRNVLNTNPTNYNHPKAGMSTHYFLGESYENRLSQLSTDGTFDKVIITNSAPSASFLNYEGATSAESGWVVDDTTNYLNYNRLFKFVGLNNGPISKHIKISIENVRESKNLNVTKYGTFDVVIRSLFEASTTNVLERYAGVNLDYQSENYIARRIGDSYRKWNTTSNIYEEFNSFPNRSNYIRIEMGPDSYAQTALPHGFEMKKMPSFAAVSGTLTSSHPDITLHNDLVSSNASKSTRYGLVTDIKNGMDIVDLLSHKHFEAPTELFHMRHLSSSGTGFIYNTGSFLNDGQNLLTSGKALGFDMPLYGGTDGKNILALEPFVNNLILDAEPDETKNAAYRAVKRAVDMVAQVDAIDMTLLAIPNLKNSNLTDYVLETAKTRGDTLAVIDLPGDIVYAFETNNGIEERPKGVADVIANLEMREIDNSYGAAYFPAVFVPSEGIFMPASIAAIGAIGGTEGRSALWFAPAGFARGGLSVATSGISVSRAAYPLNSSDRDKLYEANINPIATFPNEGVVIFGQKTLQTTPSALDRVNVRRLVNFIKKEISRAASRILFQPNVEATWNSFKAVVDPFLISIRNAYGLDDALVVLDDTTTTADLIDRNTMYCKVFLKPTRSIEYIAIDFVVTNSGAEFTEQ